MTQAIDSAEYVSRRAGERMTGLSWRGFKKLADQGLFRTLELPGLDVKYHRGDILAVMARAQKPAAAEAVTS